MLTFGSVLIDEKYSNRVVARQHLHQEYNLGNITNKDVIQYLNSFLKNVVRRNPFYKGKRYQEILDQLGEIKIDKIPILEKTKLAESASRFPDMCDGGTFFKVETSGSTGVPLRMYLDDEYYVAYYAQFLELLRKWNIAPTRISTSLMTLTVFEHLPGFCIVQPSVNHSYCCRTNINKKFWFNSEKILKYISGRKPLVLRAMPSTFSSLVDIIEETGNATFNEPELLISYAETLTDGTRHRLNSFFHAPILDEYGLTEVGGIVARQCRYQRGYHILGVDFYVEAVDENDKVVPDGEMGQLIVTNLYNKGIPIIRYRTEDYGVIVRSRCSCGISSPRIERLEGRALTRFVDKNNMTYNPFNEYRNSLFQLPIVQFQMVQEKDGRIILHYRSRKSIPGVKALEELSRKVYLLHGTNLILEREPKKYFETNNKIQSFLRIA